MHLNFGVNGIMKVEGKLSDGIAKRDPVFVVPRNLEVQHGR